MSDYYRILQVDPEAESEVIDAAYRRLARKYHPDVNESRTADARMSELNEAYEVLGNQASREAYDFQRFGHRASTGQTTEPESRTHVAVYRSPVVLSRVSGLRAINLTSLTILLAIAFGVIARVAFF